MGARHVHRESRYSVRATQADSCAGAARGDRATGVGARLSTRGGARRGGARRGARAGIVIGLCLATACRALLDYEPGLEPLPDAGGGAGALGGGAADDPAQESETASEGSVGAESDAGMAPSASSGPPTASADVERALPPCATDSSDIRESCCTAYCELFFRVCSDLPAVGSYTSSLDCLDRCYVTSGWPVGTFTEPGSISCRYVHSTLAESTPLLREVHCGHAGEAPTEGGC